MRMFQINPLLMCDTHVASEHSAIHILVKHLRTGKNIDTFLSSGKMDPSSAAERHDRLAAELVLRGGKHKTHLSDEDRALLSSAGAANISETESIDHLRKFCFFCNRRMESIPQ